MIKVPEVVANRARSVGAEQWLDELPDLLVALAAEWDFELAGDSYEGGTEAFVTPVHVVNIGPAVLKLLVPRDTDLAAFEITVLRLADGNGMVELFRADASRGALLVEQLGPSLFDLALPVDQRHHIMCQTAAKVWRPAGTETGLPNGADKAQWLIDYITTAWDELDQPCSEQAVEHAVAAAGRRIAAHDPDKTFLVHGDVNEWNVLQANTGTFKLIDPDGLLADPEYDLGIIMREDPLELMAEADPMDRANRLAQWTGLDPVKIWDWGLIERVSTGMMATKIDLQPIGAQMLAAADRLAISRRPASDQLRPKRGEASRPEAG